MNTTPKLDPETKEIWAGVRSPAGSESALGGDITELRSQLSGIDSYQSFLDQSSIDTFDAYVSGLGSEASGTLVDADDVQEARTIVEDAFADFDSFAGDSSTDTGVFGLADYDSYRTYLTDNGVGAVDADVHNRLIQDLFTADDTATEAIVQDLTSFDEFEQYLIDNGFADADAADLRSQLEAEFSNWSDFESFVDGSDSLEALLDEVDQREQATPGVEFDAGAGVLYLKAPSEIRMLKANVSAGSVVDGTNAIDFANVSVSPTSPAPGERVSVTADAENTASEAVTGAAVLRINGETRETATISLPAGATQTVRFRTAFGQIGAFSVTIGDAAPVSVGVIPSDIATTS